MSSPESERRRPRSDSGRSGGRHFRDKGAAEARQKAAPQPEPVQAAEPVQAPADEPRQKTSPAADTGIDTVWDDALEGEQGWTSTAYSNAKKAEKVDTEPEFVRPVEKEDREKTEKMDIPDGPETSFDYVAPKQTFEQHRRHPERSTLHSGKTKMASQDEIMEAEEGFVFVSLGERDKKGRKHRKHHHHHHHHSSSASSAENNAGESGEGISEITSSGSGKKHHHRHHHHHRRLRKWMKVLIIIVSVLMALVIALVGTFFVLREIGRRGMHNYDNIAIVTPTTAESHEEVMSVIDSGRTLVYNGVTYALDEDVVCMALIGVDHDIENNVIQSMGDAIYLIGLNTSNGRMSVISVSRDTMSDVNLYSDEGKYIDTEKMQMAYAYSFGNKHITGGQNTSVSLSRLFYGLPVNNYFALNLDALTTINDAIGGVTVTSSISFISPIDNREIEAGETVTLHGREVVRYVRERDKSDPNSSNKRMQRQQEYVRAFLSQVLPAVKKDLSMVTNLYNIISVNSDTNLDLPKMTYLASVMVSKMNSTSDIEYLSLRGKTVSEGKELVEFYADDTDVLETMLKVFYKQV